MVCSHVTNYFAECQWKLIRKSCKIHIYNSSFVSKTQITGLCDIRFSTSFIVLHISHDQSVLDFVGDFTTKCELWSLGKSN